MLGKPEAYTEQDAWADYSGVQVTCPEAGQELAERIAKWLAESCKWRMERFYKANGGRTTRLNGEITYRVYPARFRNAINLSRYYIGD